MLKMLLLFPSSIIPKAYAIRCVSYHWISFDEFSILQQDKPKNKNKKEKSEKKSVRKKGEKIELKQEFSPLTFFLRNKAQ